MASFSTALVFFTSDADGVIFFTFEAFGEGVFSADSSAGFEEPAGVESSAGFEAVAGTDSSARFEEPAGAELSAGFQAAAGTDSSVGLEAGAGAGSVSPAVADSSAGLSLMISSIPVHPHGFLEGFPQLEQFHQLVLQSEAEELVPEGQLSCCSH